MPNEVERAGAGLVAGRVAVVTGAGKGVGRGIALALAAEGAEVVLVGRSPGPLAAVAEEVVERRSPPGRRTRAPASPVTVVADVTRRDAVRRVAQTALEHHGHIDVVVTAAYDARVGLLDDLTPEDVRADWWSGFASVLWCLQELRPALAATSGCVITVGAATGLKPDTSTFALYASTKEAIRSLTRTAAAELAADGIRVNTLVPLATSPSFDAWAAEHPEAYDAICAAIPLGRMGDAEVDVGPVAVFLASDAGRYVTGTTLMADGGRGYLR